MLVPGARSVFLAFLVSVTFHCLGGVAAAQDFTITGTVTTAADGLSLPGAEVSIPSLGITTTTDTAGKYTLSVPANQRGQAVDLRITFPGLVPQSHRIVMSAATMTHDFSMTVGFHEEITVGSRSPGVESQLA